MTPVFANSAWVGGPERLLLRGGRWQKRRLRVRFGVFRHPTAGLALIDTGYTAHTVSATGRSFALRAYSRALRPELIAEGQPDAVLRRLGFAPEDVSLVVITHFHADHVSGLAAFPQARFLCSRAAWDGLCRSSWFENLRHGLFDEVVPSDFEERLQFFEDLLVSAHDPLPLGYDLFSDGSVVAVPLPGHAVGHAGVLFPQAEQPLLYAADVQWVMGALDKTGRPKLAPRLIAHDPSAIDQSADAVAAFLAGGGTVVLCHDDAMTPYDLENGAGL